MSLFGELVKTLRKEKGLTLEAVAKRIGSHKGYVSGIENDKVNPPSVKLIKMYARVLGQDARTLARLAWVDKAPEILRRDAEEFLLWCERREACAAREKSASDLLEPHGRIAEKPEGPSST